MKRILLLPTCLLLLTVPRTHGAAGSRNWQSGTLLETEKVEVKQGTTKTTQTDGTAKDRGKKTDYSQNTTSTTSDDVDTFQVYTIQDEKKTYVAREKLLFPWSKPANISVGEKVKFTVEKNTLFLLDDDGKQHKAGVSKVTMNTTQ
jgi:hypothetical protein